MKFLRRILGKKETPPTSDSGNKPASPVETVSESIYPPSDELQRLICMNCGQPFDTATVTSLLQNAEKALEIQKNQDYQMVPAIMVNCVKCRKLNVISLDNRILERTYHPKKEQAEAIAKPPLVPRPLSELANESGHLTCQHCAEATRGLSVKGTLLMLENSDESHMWFACETCKETSVVSKEELRGTGVS